MLILLRSSSTFEMAIYELEAKKWYPNDSVYLGLFFETVIFIDAQSIT